MSVLWNGVLPLADFLYFPVEFFSAVLVFSLPLEKKSRFPLRLLTGTVLFYAVFVLFLYSSGQAVLKTLQKSQLLLGTLFVCFLLFAVSILFLLFVYEIPPREALYCNSCAYLMEHIAYCVLILLRFITGKALPVGCAVYFLVYALVYLVVYRAFTRRMIQNRHYVTSALSSTYLALSVLTVVLVMSAVASVYGFEQIHAVYALLCCIFVLYGQRKQQKQLILQSRLDTQERLWRQQKAQYELSRETIDIVNRKCHDLKHQVAALRQIHDPGRKNEVIDSIEQSVMIYDAMLDTGNESLDTVLTEKGLLCRQKHIALNCMADGARLAFLDVVDLYTLFGNALDNAIEAVQRLPEEKRFIDLHIRMKAGVVLVRIQNPCGDLTWANGLPRSSKEANGYHGFGIKSMKECVERYHGSFAVSAADGVFTLQMAFPLEEQNTAQK